MQRQRFLVLLAILLLGAALRLVRLDALPLWKDERMTLARAGMSAPEIVEDLRISTNPPLYFLLIRAWAGIAGTSASALRLPSVLCALALIALVHRVGQRWSGDGTAQMAALVVALSPIHIYYSQEARSYALIALLALASVYLFLRWLEERRRALLLGYVAVTAAAFYTHYWIFFVVLFQNLWWLANRRGVKSRCWLAAQLAVAALFLPWVGLVVVQFESGSGNWLAPPPLDAVMKTLFRFSTGYGVDVVLPRYVEAALVPFLALYLPALLWGAFGRGPELRPWRGALAGYLLVPLVAALLVSRLGKPLYVIGRYDLVVFPAFALLVGRGLASLASRWRKAAVGLMAASTSVYLALYWFGPPVK